MNTRMWLFRTGYVLVIGVLAAVLYPVFAPVRIDEPKTPCISNLKKLGLATLTYASDHNDQFPLARNWMDAIAEHTKNEESFRCPALKLGYGYAMNRFLSGATADNLEEPSEMHLFYDSDAIGRNASEFLPRFPRPPRHRSGNYVLFADASAKCLRADH